MMTEINRVKLAAGSTLYTDDFVISTQQVDAHATWDKTVASLTDELKSHFTGDWRTVWEHETLHHKETRRRRETR